MSMTLEHEAISGVLLDRMVRRSSNKFYSANAYGSLPILKNRQNGVFRGFKIGDPPEC